LLAGTDDIGVQKCELEVATWLEDAHAFVEYEVILITVTTHGSLGLEERHEVTC
jgi:hypothetical protein